MIKSIISCLASDLWLHTFYLNVIDVARFFAMKVSKDQDTTQQLPSTRDFKNKFMTTQMKNEAFIINRAAVCYSACGWKLLIKCDVFNCGLVEHHAQVFSS